MITKERLEELKYHTIYSTLGGVSVIYLDDDTFLKDEKLYEKDRRYGNLFVGNLNNLCETKEEAEFVQKFHTSRTIYFKPPIWEKFLKTEHYDFHAQKKTMPTIINIHSKYIYVEDFEKVHLILDLSKENYYKAVECAKKLFLGEENGE